VDRRRDRLRAAEKGNVVQRLARSRRVALKLLDRNDDAQPYVGTVIAVSLSHFGNHAARLGDRRLTVSIEPNLGRPVGVDLDVVSAESATIPDWLPLVGR
jgi:hypothetical protein